MKLKLTLIAFFLIHLSFSQTIDNALLHGMKFRSIGPAGMSGRITAIDVVESDNTIIYAGSSAGGLWKSTNGGINFKPIFEGQKTASVGDIAIYQKNPNILYMGTGEGNPRNSQSYGYGMYKSTDGGKSWMHLGLEKTKNIHRVIIHPDNPDIVWAGAIGTAWGTSAERGVYKTTDGGKSWKKILYMNASTGVADMVIDPSNPNKLMVAMWEYRRWPWFMNSGGEGSGIHITMNGGDNWTKLSAANGLPKGILGRIGLSIAPGNPNVVYANIEAKEENAMYRSDNGGQSWRKTTAKGVGDRPFYYADVEVDPANENRVYHIATTVSRSEDGGKSFKPLFTFFDGVHSDHHAFWINPANPHHILDGNDGGLYASHDMGKNWRFHHNIPVGQFYHINVDNDVPYHVYGGMQDNGSWCGPAYKYELFGKILNKNFKSVGFGDGFDVIPDPSDSRYGYSQYQGGEFQRYDRKTGLVKNIKPQHPDGLKLRFNWDAAMAIDSFDKTLVYVGSQFVHKSTDRGNNWTVMSPDLTTNDPEKQKQHESGGLTIDDTTAENHTSITVIEPSSLEQGLIWVGTDDGNIQLSRDDGVNWSNVVKNVKGVPANAWVKQIKHSTYNKGEAFVVFDDHRRDNWTPYIYRTKNYGRSWERLLDEKDAWGFALSFAQDPVQPNLMFAGTEFGLYFSLNGGKNWQQWKSDFPTVSTMDMVIHPREHDLVVGTFGRSIYVLDDIRPLRALATDASIKDKALHLFDIPHAYQAVIGFPEFFAGAGDSFGGQNRPGGAMISFYSTKKGKKGSVVISITDSKGNTVREIKTAAKPGVNRISWDLKTKGGKLPGPPDQFDALFLGGAEVMPGTYTVKISFDEHTDTKQLLVKKDPKMPITEAQFKTNTDRRAEFVKATGEIMALYKWVDSVLKRIDKVKPFITDKSELKKDFDALSAKANELKYMIIEKPGRKGIFSSSPDLKSQLMSVGMYYFSSMTEPDGNNVILMRQVKDKIKQVEAKLIDFENNMVKPFKAKINAAKLVFWE